MTCNSRKAEWRFVKVDGGKTTTLRPAVVILAEGLKWKSARVTTQDGTEVLRFDAVTWRGQRFRRATTSSRWTATKFPFLATEGEVFVVKPQ